MENNITEAYIEDVLSISPAGYMKGTIAVFDNLDNFPIGKFPIRLNMALMICCTGGSANVEINLKSFSISEGEIMLVQNRQIVEATSRDNFKCFAIAVSPVFMESVAPLREKIMNIFLRVADSPVIAINREEMQELKEFYDFIVKRVNKPDTSLNKTEIVHGLCYSVLFTLGGILNSHISFEPKKVTRKEEILNHFLDLLEKNYYKEKSVSFYADKLYINPKHLTNVVKELTGKTAGAWIDNYVILEAKMLLKTTSLSVCQIAQKLNFANQSFFGKYFKHHVGMSPASYRNL